MKTANCAFSGHIERKNYERVTTNAVLFSATGKENK